MSLYLLHLDFLFNLLLLQILFGESLTILSKKVEKERQRKRKRVTVWEGERTREKKKEKEWDREKPRN